MCQFSCTYSSKQLTQLVLVVGKGTDPVGRARRQVVALRVEVEHRNRLRERRAPSMADKPLGPLLLRLGHEIHEAALVRFSERFDEVRADRIHVYILPGQPHVVQGALFERLDDFVSGF